MPRFSDSRLLVFHKPENKLNVICEFDKSKNNIFEKLIIHQKNDMAWYSKLIQNHLIDHLIPFLPLDIIHVKICIQNELRKYPVNIKSSENFYQDLNRMSQELDYDPQNSQKKYSTSGCKRVPVLVRNFIIEKGLAEYLNNEL